MLKQAVIIILLISTLSTNLRAQLPDSCKLSFGVNLGGFSDYGTEISLVDRMKTCRTWYTKDVNNPNGSPFNSDAADSLSYRPDGYPTHIPQKIANRSYEQKAVTIWAITDGWEPGKYVVLYQGTGKLSFWGGFSNLTETSPNRITFDFNNPIDNILELTIESSDINDPIHNIRIVNILYENTYDTQPFNPIWLENLLTFKSVRFMDYGHTNFWGIEENETDWVNTTLVNWDDRLKPEFYTYTSNKGAPYELMIQLMNDYDLDGWVCVPHIASDQYIEEMAKMFRNQVESERHLTVEYSNEIWNWIFAQTHFCNYNGCEITGVSWPEGIVPFVQNCLDIWSDEYKNDIERITRVVGLQAGWLDVAQRISNNMIAGSFDAVTPTFYFGFTDEEESKLDNLGSNCTVTDIANAARKSLPNFKMYMNEIKMGVSDPLGVPIVFYEGGQHLTPNPFGVEPTYAQALIDIQRDTTMYNIYNEWFDFLRTLQSGNEPLQLMNFSFISQRSARYGSWGMLESMTQDFNEIPAPKYQSILENKHDGCFEIVAIENINLKNYFSVFPNPTCQEIHVKMEDTKQFQQVVLYDLNGNLLVKKHTNEKEISIDMSDYISGTFILTLKTNSNEVISYQIFKQ